MTPTEQAADRVKALVDRLRGRPYVRTADASERLMVEAADALTALQARVGELEGALTPFAKFAEALQHMGGTTPRYGTYQAIASATCGERELTIEDYARARALLTPPLEQE